jgi:Fur family ferric uptake transcriptional regulator
VHVTAKNRTSKQRQVILDELRRVDSHPTADEVFLLVRQKMPRISLGTVYRNLEILADQGLIMRLDGGPGSRRFDGRLERHYHVRCLHCQRVTDLPALPVMVPEEAAAAVTDFQVIGHSLEFLGICPECRKQGLGAENVKRRESDGDQGGEKGSEGPQGDQWTGDQQADRHGGRTGG